MLGRIRGGVEAGKEGLGDSSPSSSGDPPDSRVCAKVPTRHREAGPTERWTGLHGWIREDLTCLLVFFAAAIFGDLQGEFQLAAEFLAIGQVELVFLDEELAVHLIGGVFDEQLVLVAGEDDADVVVLDIIDFQIDQDEAAEDGVVENEIDPVVGVVEGDAVFACRRR